MDPNSGKIEEITRDKENDKEKIVEIVIDPKTLKTEAETKLPLDDVKAEAAAALANQ